MTHFIANHPYLFSLLCVLAIVGVSNIGTAWANAWAWRKEADK
ncbi:hypothetical protein P4H42_03655 [Paenibacillus macerans]|nr:hypothetical protein [Paenibacillus macerans]MEC0328718.1 hypothetical protein [Paenibacillus macerans]